MLLLGVFLLDPIVRAYPHLRKFLLTVRICIFVALFCVLGPVIRHFGMLGAALTSVGAQVLERIFIAWAAARAVDASVRDLRLYTDLFKITGVTVFASLVAYAVRNLIPSALLIPRILAVGLCVSAIYLPAMFVFRLPGWDLLSRERITAFLRTTLGRLRNASA